MDVFSAVAQGASRRHLREAALAAGWRLGLFPPLQQAPLPAAALARQLGLKSGRRLEALLDVLALEGLLARAGDGYLCAAPPPLAPAMPAAGWGRLAEVIRSDVPLEEPGVRGESAGGDALARFHAHLCSAGAAAAAELMAPLARAEGGALLDLGSGAGAYARAWLAARADVRAILLDRPEVLALAGAALEAGRVELRAADLFAPPAWPEAQVVLLANLLHLFGPDEAQALVSRAARAARPGGLVVLKDLALAPDRSGPAEGVLFSLNMALFTERGQVHTTAALRQMLSAAGLIGVELRALSAAPDAVVALGRRGAEEPR